MKPHPHRLSLVIKPHPHPLSLVIKPHPHRLSLVIKPHPHRLSLVRRGVPGGRGEVFNKIPSIVGCVRIKSVRHDYQGFRKDFSRTYPAYFSKLR